MGFFDTLSDIGNWVSSNSNVIKPIVGAGLGAYALSQQNNQRKEAENFLRGQIDADYQRQLAEYNARVAAAGASGSGGGGGGGGGAAAANWAAQQAALKRAKAEEAKYFKQAQALYSPYVQAGKELLPGVQKTYADSLNGMGMLFNYLSTPEQLAKMNASVPAYQTNIPLPEYMKNG